jgi:hypothetical protein
VLVDVYFRADYKKAMRDMAPHVRDSASEDDLRELAESLIDSHGELMELQRDSFERVPGRDAIVLYYAGINERGPTYHRVLLRGEEETYRVAGLFWSEEPFKSSSVREKFDGGAVIRSSGSRLAPEHDPDEFQPERVRAVTGVDST